MAKKTIIKDEQMDDEISLLRKSPYVKLARKEQKLAYRHRQYLYSLRNLEKRGKQLMAHGITTDNIEEMLFGDIEDLEDMNDGD